MLPVILQQLAWCACCRWLFGKMLCCSQVALAAAGIGIGFWTADQVFEEGLAAEDITVFQPRISADVADARFAKWNKAVQLSLGLHELSE
jgi:glycerol kinase